jgi:small subunit ribosomal protein S16
VAVKIRLKRMGKIRVPHYRIVVADSRTKRDGRVIEEIGKYHPKEDPSLIEVDSDRAEYWLGVGAQPSEPVLALLKLTGDWQRFQGDADAVSTVRGAETRREKAELFNEALKDAHNEPKTEAVSRPRKTAKKTSAAPPAAAESAAAADEAAPPADPPEPDSGASTDAAAPAASTDAEAQAESAEPDASSADR